MLMISCHRCVESLTVYFLAVLLDDNDEDHYCPGANMVWHNHEDF